MKFTNAIILALSTQTTLSQAANFRGTYITSDADFDTQRQQLVQSFNGPSPSNGQKCGGAVDFTNDPNQECQTYLGILHKIRLCTASRMVVLRTHVT